MEKEQKVEVISENLESKQERLNPQLYTMFRLDGHSFSKFVKAFKMKLPFDDNFTTAMTKTAIQAMRYYHFFVGFIGSDEMTFAIRPLTEEQISKGATMEFSGRVQKMTSLLAGFVSTIFYRELTILEGFEKTKNFSPHFDCRVFQVKSLKYVLQNISQRVKYTLKNSRMMLAQTYFSQKQLNKIASSQAVEKLKEQKNIIYEEVVESQNRVGTILFFEKTKDNKQLTIKGETKVVQFQRSVVSTRSMGPKEVLEMEQLLQSNVKENNLK